MPQIWLFGDLHFLHPKVALLRGFNSVEHHDSTIIHNIKKVVRDGDECWHLGDDYLGDKDAGLAMIADLPGTHYSILGNHDPEHPMHPGGARRMRRRLEVFEAVMTAAQINYQGLQVMLSHFPYEGDTEGREHDRHVQWRLRDEGRPLVHAHTHSTEPITYSSKGTVQMCVSLDARSFKPVTLHTVLHEAGLL